VRRFLAMEGAAWRQLGREEICLHLLFVSYTLFLAGFFYVPNAVDLYKFYSVAVLLPALLLLPWGVRLLQGNLLFLLVIGYLGYMLLTPAWGDHFEWRVYFNDLRLALYVVVFVVATVLLRQHWPRPFAVMLRCISLLVAVAALISLVLWYRDPSAGPRLIGIGILENPNPSGYVYAVFAVMNLAYVLERQGRPWLRVLHALAVLSLCVFVLFSYSRGALLALVAACLVFFIGRFSRNAVVVMVVLAVSIFMVYHYFPQVDAALDRGIGARPDIWRIVLSRIAEAPLLGHGYLTDQFVQVRGTGLFAHNAYLASLRDGGLVGGLLMLAMLGMACFQAWRVGRGSGDYRYLALLVLALVCMSFDTDRLLTRPRELWLVLWWPLALVLSDAVVPVRTLSESAANAATTGQL